MEKNILGFVGYCSFMRNFLQCFADWCRLLLELRILLYNQLSMIAYETKTAPGMDGPFDRYANDRFQPNTPGNRRSKKQ